MKIVILDSSALNPGDLSWEGFEKYGQVTAYPNTAPGELLSRAEGARVLITNKVVLSGGTLRNLPECKYIGVLATGYNVVDIDAAKSLGITVTNVPAYSTKSVAQLVFGMLLECEHKVSYHARLGREEWKDNDIFCMYRGTLHEIYGKTFGIFGYGEIGRETAKIANAFGMKVIVYSRTKKDDETVEWVKKEELFKRADYLSLHCPLTPDTEKLINPHTLSLMKEGAVLINTTRGGTVDERAVAEALDSGKLRAFCADVLSSEPPKADNPLLSAKNCIITPHIAWATIEARERLMNEAVENLSAYLRGEKRNCI